MLIAIIIAIGAAIASIASIFDGFKKQDKVSPIKIIRLISCLVVLGGAIFLALDQQTKAEGKNPSDKIDSGKNNIVVDKAIDTTNKKDHKVVSQKSATTYIEPDIDFYKLPENDNPTVVKTGIRDSFIFRGVYVNRGGQARKMWSRYAVVIYRPGHSVSFVDTFTRVLGKGARMLSSADSMGYVREIPFSIRSCTEKDTAFIFIVHSYEGLTGRKVKPIMRLYKFTIDRINKPLIVPFEAEFDKVYKYLEVRHFFSENFNQIKE